MGKNQLHIYTGDGKGKTSAALGVVMRSLGQGKKVFVGQFLKGNPESGEYLLYERLFKNYPNLEWKRWGRQGFIDPKALLPEDQKVIKEGLGEVGKLKGKRYDLIVLDELSVAILFRLTDVQSVIDLVDDLLRESNVIVTGRGAPEELLERADLVTRMELVKHPFEKGEEAMPGLDY